MLLKLIEKPVENIPEVLFKKTGIVHNSKEEEAEKLLNNFNRI